MKTLIKKIKGAGIIGAGGAGFPTHIKLQGKAKYIIINGAECEPLLQVDYSIGKKYSEKLVKALNYIMNELQIEKGFFAFKGKHEDLIHEFNKNIEQYKKVFLVTLPDVYPIGDEVILTYEVLGKVVSKGAIPIEKEVIIINLETLFNIYKIVFENKNVTDTYVTVTGEVKKPGTYLVPVGISIKQFFEFIGGTKTFNYKIIMGGPMTGKVVNEYAIITKTTKGIIVLNQNHPLIIKKDNANIKHLKKVLAACSQCRMCTDMCPRNLIGHNVKPHLLMNSIANGVTKHSSAIYTSLGCCECGVCEMYACDQSLSPMKFMIQFKEELMKNGIRPNSEDMTEVSKERSYRKVPSSRLVSRLGLSKYIKKLKLSEEIFKPSYVKIPLKQHIGIPAKVNVQINDLVERGKCIGVCADGISASVHASISGKVTEITEAYIKLERVDI